MNIHTVIFLAAGAAVLAGCASRNHEGASDKKAERVGRVEKVDTTPSALSTETTLDGYKRDLAQRIAQVNSTQVYAGRPQALLRSVVVVKYAVDANGNLLRSEIMRSNRDRETEAAALTSLRNTAPFPKPASHLLRQGKVEISETWLFNNDGRFQLRTIAQPQMDQ